MSRSVGAFSRALDNIHGLGRDRCTDCSRPSSHLSLYSRLPVPGRHHPELRASYELPLGTRQHIQGDVVSRMLDRRESAGTRKGHNVDVSGHYVWRQFDSAFYVTQLGTCVYYFAQNVKNTLDPHPTGAGFAGVFVGDLSSDLTIHGYWGDVPTWGARLLWWRDADVEGNRQPWTLRV